MRFSGKMAWFGLSAVFQEEVFEDSVADLLVVLLFALLGHAALAFPEWLCSTPEDTDCEVATGNALTP